VAPVTTIIETPFDRDDSGCPSDSRHDRTNYTIFNMLERVQDVDAVLVVFENGLLFIAAGGDVLDSTGVFDAEGTGHNDQAVARK
jgi:hypothetical protein